MLKELAVAVERLAQEFLKQEAEALVVKIKDNLSSICTVIKEGEQTLENSYLFNHFDQLLKTVTEVIDGKSSPK